MLYKNFGFRVKIERMKQNLTQERLAEVLRVDVRYLSSVECGHQNVTLKTIEKIADALGIETYKLFVFD